MARQNFLKGGYPGTPKVSAKQLLTPKSRFPKMGQNLFEIPCSGKDCGLGSGPHKHIVPLGKFKCTTIVPPRNNDGNIEPTGQIDDREFKDLGQWKGPRSSHQLPHDEAEKAACQHTTAVMKENMYQAPSVGDSWILPKSWQVEPTFPADPPKTPKQDTNISRKGLMTAPSSLGLLTPPSARRPDFQYPGNFGYQESFAHCSPLSQYYEPQNTYTHLDQEPQRYPAYPLHWEPPPRSRHSPNREEPAQTSYTTSNPNTNCIPMTPTYRNPQSYSPQTENQPPSHDQQYRHQQYHPQYHHQQYHHQITDPAAQQEIANLRARLAVYEDPKNQVHKRPAPDSYSNDIQVTSKQTRVKRQKVGLKRGLLKFDNSNDMLNAVRVDKTYQAFDKIRKEKPYLMRELLQRAANGQDLAIDKDISAIRDQIADSIEKNSDHGPFVSNESGSLAQSKTQRPSSGDENHVSRPEDIQSINEPLEVGTMGHCDNLNLIPNAPSEEGVDSYQGMMDQFNELFPEDGSLPFPCDPVEIHNQQHDSNHSFATPDAVNPSSEEQTPDTSNFSTEPHTPQVNMENDVANNLSFTEMFISEGTDLDLGLSGTDMNQFWLWE